jgi:hypothetical protein
MSKVITYKNASADGCYCQIQLDSGERVLISIAQSGIALFQLDVHGLTAIATLAEWSTGEIPEVIQLFADLAIPEKPPLDAIRDRLLQCSSILQLMELISPTSRQSV